MSQINVNPGGPGPVYRDDGGAAAAGIGMAGIIMILAFIILLAVLAYGAFAGHWFGNMGSTNSTTNVNVSAPAARPSPAGNTNVNVNLPSPATSPAASR